MQQERATSIAAALQSYQQPSIVTEISVSENWVDFLNDLSSTKYAYLAELSKANIKEKLKDKSVSTQLEPYLQKHRKAIIILELEKKDKYRSVTANKLIELFTQSISAKNIEQAIEIQNSIFEKVKYLGLPTDYIDQLEVPEKSEYGLLLNKNSIFKYLMSAADVYETYKKLNDLQDLMPNESHLKYNICAIKFKLWLLGESAVDPINFKKEIVALSNYGIEDKLVKRMLINYEIVMCEYYMQNGDFANKDKSLDFISKNYEYIQLNDYDYLSLAQYFSSYAKYEWATKLLEKEVKSVDVNEDLLFYFLNLTIINKELTKNPGYRSILLNAFNINPSRFCDLFKPMGKGGITFQLLEDEYLHKTYCENCK